jgi:transposase InsO family protein
VTAADRFLWARLSRFWTGWRSALVIVKPETLIAWHRKGFRVVWTWKVRRGQPGRPPVSREMRKLIRQMSRENPLWGARASTANCLSSASTSAKPVLASIWREAVGHRRRPLANLPGESLPVHGIGRLLHVPTVRFQVLYVFLVLAHNRRRILHFAVTPHPTAEWTAQQLREAFAWDSAPRFLLRDRDRIFGSGFTKEVKEFWIQEVLGAPGVPQQRAYVERLIGTIRRECLDHLIIVNGAALHRHLKLFLEYYHGTRTHLSLEKDTPGGSFGAAARVGARGSSGAGWRAASSVRTSRRLNRAGMPSGATVTLL